MDEKETCPRDGFGKILQGQVSEDDQRTISYGPYAHQNTTFYCILLYFIEIYF